MSITNEHRSGPGVMFIVMLGVMLISDAHSMSITNKHHSRTEICKKILEIIENIEIIDIIEIVINKRKSKTFNDFNRPWSDAHQ